MSMYVRVKRKKTTMFILCEATDTITTLKTKLQSLVSAPPDNQRLLLKDNVLADAKTLGDQKVDNDAIVYLLLKKEGSSEWETVEVDDFSKAATS
eukprot:TRINITY_DN65048_c0_g1_i1.p1 TRINITY_DN65048_c0_g1~~TRINITY_DN65048_c0_g1_i1.p1  ORF type:complete len:102 (+),score=22.47 TRINITY_DN65048_c0_g1_i1:22-306(+)